MGLSEAELEGCVDSLYELGGIKDRDRVLFPSRLARRILGEGAIVRSANMIDVGRLSRVMGRQVIAVRQSLSPQRAEHAIGHELGHWLLARDGYDDDDEEQACDFIGAAIQTRRSLFRRRAIETGANFRQLAFDFEVTESSAALRYGETIGTPIALICDASVRVRGDAWQWGTETDVRSLSKRRAPRGVRKTKLTDERKRVALVAETNQ